MPFLPRSTDNRRSVDGIMPWCCSWQSMASAPARSFTSAWKIWTGIANSAHPSSQSRQRHYLSVVRTGGRGHPRISASRDVHEHASRSLFERVRTVCTVDSRWWPERSGAEVFGPRPGFASSGRGRMRFAIPAPSGCLKRACPQNDRRLPRPSRHSDHPALHDDHPQPVTRGGPRRRGGFIVTDSAKRHELQRSDVERVWASHVAAAAGEKWPQRSNCRDTIQRFLASVGVLDPPGSQRLVIDQRAILRWMIQDVAGKAVSYAARAPRGPRPLLEGTGSGWPGGYGPAC